jgi:hypothetical protein
MIATNWKTEFVTVIQTSMNEGVREESELICLWKVLKWWAPVLEVLGLCFLLQYSAIQIKIKTYVQMCSTHKGNTIILVHIWSKTVAGRK